MDFHIPGSPLRFSIPDDWLEFRQCALFQRVADFYMYPRELDPDTDIVAIEQIEPPQRDTGIPPFKIHRLVPVLLGLQSTTGVIPPIEVDQLDTASYRY
jgi:hypothetical protein